MNRSYSAVSLHVLLVVTTVKLRACTLLAKITIVSVLRSSTRFRFLLQLDILICMAESGSLNSFKDTLTQRSQHACS